jgi:dynein heavy chain 2, cytosolic
MILGNYRSESINNRIFGSGDQLEIIEKLHDILDDIWRQQDHEPYPIDRMKHILSIIAEDFIGCVQNQLSKFDLMNDSLLVVMEPLRESKQVCENLVTTFDTLTAKIWPNSTTNKWNLEPFTFSPLQNLLIRLTIVFSN